MERNTIIQGFRTQGIEYIKKLKQNVLYTFILDANQAYTQGQSFLTDGEYDTILDYAKQKKTLKTKLDKVIGAPVANARKTKLPYFMGSMNKIKPNTGEIKQWKNEFPEPYVLSAKLDGVSGLYMCKNDKAHLYTRGNGSVGQDISFLIPYLNLPYIDDLVVRGEFLISKEDFKKWKSQFSNARNLVAGLINSKTIEPERFADLKFVCYEIIQPSIFPSAGFGVMKDYGFDVVKNTKVLMKNNLTESLLSKMLLHWRSTLQYEIDGIIVESDHIYSRKNENPKHAFAFKMIMDDQRAETSVLDVIWTPSKDGYLKPRVQIQPVTIGGATIEYVTGFNGKFIQDNNIGPGAVIQIIRSGDVIPHIVAITQPSTAKMPSEEYIWNETHIDILLKDKENNDIVLQKQLTLFFQRCGVLGMGEGIVKRLIEGGYRTIISILKMTQHDFLKLHGFQETMAFKLVQELEKCKQAPFKTLLFASNILGRGIAEKKLNVILQYYPGIFVEEESIEIKIEKIASLPGFAMKTATLFVHQLPKIIHFFKTLEMENKLYSFTKPNNTIKTDGKLYGKNIVITGFRDKSLEDVIHKEGGTIQNTVNKKTNFVIVKDKNTHSQKIQKAKQLEIPIYKLDEFQTNFNLG